MKDKNNIKVVGFSGSLRRDSYNRKLLQVAKKFAREYNAEVKEADLKELNLPIYDQDIEDESFPKSVLKLKKMAEEADVLLIASPEYNRSVSGALKNAIDWLSRGQNSLDGKIAAIFGVSDGMFGTVRGQLHLRQILAALNVFILPQPEVYVRFGAKAFDEKGNLVDEKTYERLKSLVFKTIDFAKKVR